MKKLAVLSLSLLLALCALAGCAANASPAATDAAQTFVFTDSCGREVTLPTELTRAAPSGYSAQIMLYTVNPDCMVGWSTPPSDEQKKYFAEKYWSLPVFGQFYGKNVNLNLEAIVQAAPQVIVDIGDKKENHAADMDTIQEQTGIPTIFIESNLDTYPQAYRTLGALFDCEEACEQKATYIESVLARAQENTATLSEDEKVRVYYGTGETGLDANAKGSIHAAVLDIVGADNVAVVSEVSSKGGGNTVSMEQLLTWNPSVILLAEEHCYEDVQEDPLWAGLLAMQTGDVYCIPSGPFCWTGTPPSVNRILGVQWLGNLLYPQLYQDDMVEVAQTFYEMFWQYDLTDAEAQALLEHAMPA